MKRLTSVLSVLIALLMVLNITAFAEGGNGGGDSPLTFVSAKVGDTELEGSRVAPGSVITLTFSINVTDESVLENNIGKVKVKNADGAVACTVSAGEEKTVLLVTLGDLAKGDYTLSIGGKLAAKNGNTLGDSVEIAFSVKGDGTGTGGGNNPLALVSVKVGDADLKDAEVEADGKIVITFDRGMTANQDANFELIGIYDAQGKKVEGTTLSEFTKDESGNSFTELSYSGLAAGSYTLKLGAGLKANNGNTLGEDVEISFTVAGSGEEEEPEEEPNFFVKAINAIKDFFMMIINFFKGLFA